DVLGVAVIPYAIPDSSNGVQSHRLVDGGIDVENAHTFARLGFQRQAGVLVVHRIVVEDLAIDQGVLPTGAHADIFGGSPIGEQIALYQYVLPVRLRIILAVTFRRIDDNDAVHPAGDVLGHGIGATVINKDTWVVGME